MEKSKFLTIYTREISRIRKHDTENKAKRWQKKDNTVNQEYSESSRLIYALEAIENAYNNSASDNLSFNDQLAMDEYIKTLKDILEQYFREAKILAIGYKTDSIIGESLEVIEEMITLANLYLGMQVSFYPAFYRIMRKNYISNNLIDDSPELEFEIKDFNTTFSILRSLETYNRIKLRYEIELGKLSRNHLNVEYNNCQNIEEVVSVLETKLKQIKKKIQPDVINLYSKHNNESKVIMLTRFIEEVEHAIKNYSNYNLKVLEMMIELIHILCDMPIYNFSSFKILVDNDYIENHMLINEDIEDQYFEQVYPILLSFVKRL